MAKLTVGSLIVIGLVLVGGTAVFVKLNPFGLGQKAQELATNHPFL